jgi:hypothetical protein
VQIETHSMLRVDTIVIELPGEKTSKVILEQRYNDFFSSQIGSQHMLILSWICTIARWKNRKYCCQQIFLTFFI